MGVNWIFVRASDGSKMPFFDNLRESQTDVQEVSQFELGYKHSADNFDLYATAFFNEVTGDSFVAQPGQPAPITTNEAYDVELELDFNYYHDNGFSVNLGATLQDTELTQASNPDNVGNQAQRLANWQVRITPSYDLEFDNGM